MTIVDEACLRFNVVFILFGRLEALKAKKLPNVLRSCWRHFDVAAYRGLVASSQESCADFEVPFRTAHGILWVTQE